MPRPGYCWRHVVVNTHSSWLHGDGRGFRSRGHRIHSSGDYRNPPPPGEHAKLYRYQQSHSRRPVAIPPDLRGRIGQWILDSMRRQGYSPKVLVVSERHAHVLLELPISLAMVKAVVGEAKRSASYKVRDRLRGSLWSAGATYKIVKDTRHLRRAYDHILYEQERGTWTWCFRDADDGGVVDRERNPGRRSSR